MKRNARFAIHALQALAVGVALASAASAGCGDLNGLSAPFQFAQPQAAALALRAAVSPSRGSLSNNAMLPTASPIGMWNIQFISLGNGSHNPTIPDGALIDFGYVQLHSDGTEIMNSGAHAPATQNFCMGVWVRTGMFTYEVNHFALSYDSTSGMLANKVNIREQIALDPSGNELSGAFTIDIYNAAGAQKVDHVAGTIAATRVTVDQITP